jgi:hypothetical protein
MEQSGRKRSQLAQRPARQSSQDLRQPLSAICCRGKRLLEGGREGGSRSAPCAWRVRYYRELRPSYDIGALQPGSDRAAARRQPQR